MDAYQELFHQMPDVVIGGFHTAGKGDFEPSMTAQLYELARELKETGAVFYTCHCTGQEPYEILRTQMGANMNYLATGDEIGI